MKKRIVAIFLALMMVLTILPMGTFTALAVSAEEAAGTTNSPDTEAMEEATPGSASVESGTESDSQESTEEPAKKPEVVVPIELQDAVPVATSATIKAITYREKGTGVYMPGTTETITSEYNMYCIVPDEVKNNLDSYTFLVTAPEGQPVEQKVSAAGGTGSYALWEYKPEKTGTYTVTIKNKDTEEEVAKGTVEIIAVKFHTGEGGKFDGDKTEHTSYYNKPTSQYSVYFDRYGIIPTLNPVSDAEDQAFIGWSAQEKPEGYESLVKNADLFTLIQDQKDTEDAKNGIYNVYAVYTKKRIYSFAVKDGENEITALSDFDLGSANSPYISTSYTKTLTFENTGNQDLTITPITTPNFLNAKYSNNTGTGIQTITIKPGATCPIVLTPKENLASGEHRSILNFRVNERNLLYSIYVKFTVLSGSLVVVPEAVTKEYGDILTAESISNPTIYYENTNTKYEGSLSDLGITLSSAGFQKDAQVGEYPYTLNTSTNPSLTVKLAENAPKVTVVQDTPKESSIETTSVHVGNSLSASTLTGTFANSHAPDMNVTGTLEWENPEQSVGDTEGTIQAKWKFTPHDTQNYKETSGTVEVIVSKKEATILTRNPACLQTATYDGTAHAMTYVSDRTDDSTPIQVKYRPENGTDNDWTATAPINAGVYEVEVSIAESSKYAPATMYDTLTIERRTLTFSAFEVWSKRYDGTKTATLHYFRIDNCVDRGINATAVAEFESPDANRQAKVVITVTGLTGNNIDNYKLPDNPVYHTISAIYPKTLTITPKEFTKEYGKLLFLTAADFNITGLVDGDNASLEFISEGELADANVSANGYPITAELTNTNYTFDQNLSSKLMLECGTVKVTKATPMVNGSLSVGAGRKGGKLAHVTLAGGFVNANNSEMPVAGTLTWKNDSVILPENENSYEAAWVFTPEDIDNYEPVEGKVTITLQDKESVFITITGETEVTYDGKPHGLDATLEPAADYTVEYSVHGTNIWSEGEPVNAGIYDVRITAYPIGEYLGSQVTTVLDITAAKPKSTAPTELKMPEGTPLNSETVQAAFTGCFTFNGQPVDGVLSWLIPDGVITDDGLEFIWVFTPVSGNFTTVGGVTTFTLADDNRTISADIYNLPASLGYKDYAVIDIGESGLKAGDAVMFFKDDAHSDPVSDNVTVTDEDINNGFLVIWLDDDALQSGEDGALYVCITSSRKNPVTALSYIAEPGFLLEDNGGGPNESILVHPDIVTIVKAKLFNTYYEVQSVDFALMDTTGVVTMQDGTDGYTRRFMGHKQGGDATLAVTVNFRHPDPAHANEMISFTLTKPIVCSGSLDAKAESGLGAPEVTVDEQEMRNTLITEEDRKALAEGKKIDYLLHVENENAPEVSEDEKTAIKNILAKEKYNFTVGQYLDISLTRSINNGGAVEVKETARPLTLTIHVLPELMKAAVEAAEPPQFIVIRMHNGEATILKDLDADPNTITISTDLFSTYAIAYRNPLGKLTVSNSVTGSGDKNKEFTFTVMLGDTSVSGQYGGMNFTDGVAKFTLRHGESLTAENLPTGVPYTVIETEANKDGYTTTSTGATGAIQEGEVIAAFTNDMASVPESTQTPTQITTERNTGDNVTTPSPKTGDGNMPMLWMMITLVSGVGFCVCAIAGSKRRRNRHND